MSAPARVALFAAGLAVAFAGAFAAGRALDPNVDGGDAAHGEPAAHAGGAGEQPTAQARGADEQATAHGGGADEHASAHARGTDERAQRAARIVVERRRFEPGVAQPLTFRVVDGAGRTVRDFDVEHERAMHVIAVRRDLTGYRHLHPRQRADGSWTVDVAFAEPGPQRVYADFVSAGRPQTLAADVTVAGRYAARPLPAPAQRADAGDGYAVTATADGDVRRYVVTRDGEPVDDVEPYLGARGHLVAIRERDLAFQHVHPRDAAEAGREIAFDVALAGGGRHRLFLQFKHDGRVRTAAFTEDGAGTTARGGDDHGEAGHGH